MILGDCTDAHQSGDNGNVIFFREFGEFLRRAGSDDSAARIDARTLGFRDCRTDGFDLLRLRSARNGVCLHRRLRVEDERQFRLLNIFRNVDENRTRTTGVRKVERIHNRRNNVLRLENEIAVFHNRAGHADDIGLLEGVFADVLGSDLTGDDDHRNGIHICVGNAGEEVRRSRSAGCHADPGLAADARITVRAECAALLMTGQNHANGGILQSLVEFNSLTARIGENEIDAEFFQCLDCDLSTLDRGIVLRSCHNFYLSKKFCFGLKRNPVWCIPHTICPAAVEIRTVRPGE